MKDTPQLQSFKQLAEEHDKFKNPYSFSMRSVIYPTCMSSRSTTGGLTRCIINYIRLMGWQAERISTSGRMIDNTKIVTNHMGFQKRIGSTEWIPGTSTKGSADISATIEGKAVKIEVKNIKTKDRKSNDQIIYGETIDISGGVYYIAKDFDTAIQWLIDTFKHNTTENKHRLWTIQKLA